MFRYYKGEAENPFDSKEQNAAHMFWFYESIFEGDFQQFESSDWFSFFSGHGLGKSFMELISEEDYERPTAGKKKQVFELWLIYFFKYKLYPEYGGENWYKTSYYTTNDIPK